MEMPAICVVIPTRDRGDTILVAIKSLLRNSYGNFTIVVIDQSFDTVTRDAVARFGEQVEYFRSDLKGVAIARNLGVQHAGCEYIGFIDDDCEVADDWVAQMAAALEGNPLAGAVFGNVLAAAHDTARGFIPAYVRTTPGTARSIRQKNDVEGISACMGIRRETWRELNGFDPMLGAGTTLGSGAESDYVIRLLLSGHQVFETPALTVTHHGFRDWRQGRQLVARYWHGTGAMFAKHFKCGNWSVMRVLLALSVRWVAGGRSTLARSFGGRSYRWTQVAAFVRGFALGVRTPVDKSLGLFGTRPIHVKAVIESSE